MTISGRFLTNALLFLIVLLLAANLVLPDWREREKPGGPPADDDLVVRIPAEQARELGIREGDFERLAERLTSGDPNDSLLSARLNANETATIATLRNICSSQAQIQACAIVDQDNDGTGEYGSFGELSGAVVVRGGSSSMNPPALSGAFRVVNENGAVERSGYRFLIYLPDADGRGIVADGADTARIDAGKSEGLYCVYAWPVRQGHSGHRSFMMSQSGDIFSTETEDYTESRAPKPGAGFRDRGAESILGEPAIGEEGQDGHEWRQVN